MAADGVREITLLGQNVNSYGRDLRPPSRATCRLPAATRATRTLAAPIASFAELLRRSTRSTGSSGSATPARTRRTCART